MDGGGHLLQLTHRSPLAEVQVRDSQTRGGVSQYPRRHRTVAPLPRDIARNAISSIWFERAVRFGHAAKGIVFGGIGFMAARLALGERDETPDFPGAMEAVADQPLDALFLGVLSLGLFAYAAWRIARGVLDLEGQQEGVKGLFNRATMLGVGFLYVWFGIYAIGLLTGLRRDDEGIDDETATVLTWPLGEYLVGGIAAGVVIAGLWETFVAFTGRFRDEFGNVRLGRWERALVMATGWWGHAARGVIYCVAGGYGIKAAITFDPDDAKGFAETLWEITRAPYGDWALLFVAAGLSAFGAYSLLLAFHRHVPAAGPDESELGDADSPDRPDPPEARLP